MDKKVIVKAAEEEIVVKKVVNYTTEHVINYFGINTRDIFVINKKYPKQEKTLIEWTECLERDGISYNKDCINKLN